MTPSEGAIARDEAIVTVSENNKDWQNEMINFIEQLPTGWTGTGEDIRHLALAAGIGHPIHHNAWGAMIMNVYRHKKLLEKTGNVRSMRDKSSHARLTWEYIRT